MRKVTYMFDGAQHVIPDDEDGMHRRSSGCPCEPSFVASGELRARGWVHRSMKPGDAFPERWTEEDTW